jgi:hypothetical protein
MLISFVPGLTDEELRKARELFGDVRKQIIYKKGHKTEQEVRIATNAGLVLIALAKEIEKRAH